jgi:predicted nucleic acid-binding protein
MKIFLDANILVSVLNKEYPLFTYSSRIISLTDNKNFEVYTSALCLAIAFYFAEKKSGTRLARQKIELLATKLSITNTGENEVLKTMQNKKVNDFEDGLEYYSALASDCKLIITEDRDDFYFSKIEIMKTEDFLRKVVLK